MPAPADKRLLSLSYSDFCFILISVLFWFLSYSDFYLILIFCLNLTFCLYPSLPLPFKTVMAFEKAGSYESRSSVCLFFGLPLPVLFRDLVEVGRSRLVDIIIDPVAVKVIAVRPPLQQGTLSGIIIREIILGDLDGQTLADVPVVLIPEGIAVVFRMSHHKKPSPISGHAQKDACFFGFRKDPELFAGVDRLGGNLCVAAVGDQEIVIKTADNGFLAVTDFVGI